MTKIETKVVIVRTTSLHQMSEMGLDVQSPEDVEAQVTSLLERRAIFKRLTPRQREVAALLESGFKRKEIAQMLQPPVVLQAVNQIIIRMRKNLTEGGVGVKRRRS